MFVDELNCLWIMSPPLPLIAIASKNASLLLITGDFPLHQASALYLFKSDENTCYYDGDGKVWKSRIIPLSYKPTLFKKLLAYTFYNPLLAVTRTWDQVSTYSLTELKGQISKCIDRDDDLMTQWIGPDELKELLLICDDFSAIVKMLSDYVFYPDMSRIDGYYPDED